MVRDSSAESKRINDAAGITSALEQKIINCLGRRTMTRRMLAQETGIETATLSGAVNRMLAAGRLDEAGDKRPCAITGRRVYWLRRREFNLPLFSDNNEGTKHEQRNQ